MQDQMTRMMQGMGGAFPFAKMAADHMAWMQKSQHEVIDKVQAVSERWSARQHAAVSAWQDLMRTALQPTNPMQNAEAWMKWYSGTLARLSEDAGDRMSLITTLAASGGARRLDGNDANRKRANGLDRAAAE